MIVCHSRQFIFLKTRKTAGTSLEVALSKLCGDHDTLPPLTSEDAQLRMLISGRSAQNYDFREGRMKRHSIAEESRPPDK